MVWQIFGGALALVTVISAIVILYKRQSLESEQKLQNLFKALAFDVFEKNSRLFLEYANSTLESHRQGAKDDLDFRQKAISDLMKPFMDSLDAMNKAQRELESKRENAYATLFTQIDSMIGTEKDLRKETSQLVSALKSPQIRGAWGELHLKRVLELAGLLNHCDFFEQKSLDLDGKIFRPDVIIRMPEGKSIVIDSKAPIQSYLEAAESQDDSVRAKKHQDHANAIRKHIKDLSSKEYWKLFDASIDCVILFLPSEAFFTVALQADPSLIEVGADQNVMIATPSTLIMMLRSIAFSWKQDALSKNAKEIAKLGQELYDRIGVMCEHWHKLGRNLNSCVESYNAALSSLESRVLVSSRKLKDLGSISSQISEPVKVESSAKVSMSTLDEISL